MKLRRIFSFLLALVFVMSMGTAAFADTWYLENGDITVDASEGTQYVYQDEVAKEDSAPVITQYDSSTPTDSQIIIYAPEGSTANVTIQDVNIESDEGYSSVCAYGDLVLDVEGSNTLTSYIDEGSAESPYAIVWVQEDLTIQGSGTLTVTGDTHGAKIGSDAGQDFDGTLHITGDVTIITSDDYYGDESGDGAAIGSGLDGSFTGSVIIDGNANVTAKSNDGGAGIGAGEGSWYEVYDEEGNSYEENCGDFRGSVTIGGNATVWAEGDDDAAGIGSGQDGSFSGGSIIIKDNAIVHAEGSDEGPGIGAADDSSMDGSITIKDDARVTIDRGSESDVDIGGEGSYAGSGSISILDNASVNTADGSALVIGGENVPGSDEDVTNDLKLTIGDNTTLNGYKGSDVKENIQGGYLSVASEAKAAEAAAEPVYFEVVDEDGKVIACTQDIEDEVLTVTVDAENAVLRGNRQALLLLLRKNVDSLRFVTESAQSEFRLKDIMVLGTADDIAQLSHKGAAVSFEIGSTDAAKILK